MSRFRPTGLVIAVVVFGALVAFPFLVPANWIVNIAIFTLMYAGLATAWNLLGGYSGYVSLGHVAFFGIGAYAIAIAFQHGVSGTDMCRSWSCPCRDRRRPVSISDRVGRVPDPRLHVRDRHVDVPVRRATAGVQPAWVDQRVAGIGMAVPPFPVETYERPFYLAMLALFGASMLGCWYVRSSKLGLMLFAIRDDEDRARGVGVRTEPAKLITFAISVGLTAMIGGVWAYYLTFIYPQFAIDPLITIGTVLMVYLGGKGTLWGPALGAAILVPAQQYLAYRLGASQLYLVGYASVFLVVMLVLPRGRSHPSAIGSTGRARVAPAASSAAMDRDGRCIRRRERERRDDRCTAAPRGAGPPEALRGCRRRRRMLVRRSAEDRDRVDRPERLRQDDGVQRGDRYLRADAGPSASTGTTFAVPTPPACTGPASRAPSSRPACSPSSP